MIYIALSGRIFVSSIITQGDTLSGFCLGL